MERDERMLHHAKTTRTRHVVPAVFVFVFAAIMLAVFFTGCTTLQQGSSSASGAAGSSSAAASSSSVDIATSFPSWNPDSEALKKIVAFVNEATDEKSAHFIPPEDRIVTFDMDGTVICEKAPVYVDYCMLLYRVLEDPTYKADAETIDLCNTIRDNADRGIVDASLDVAKGKAFARVFAGMTPEQLRAYVNDFVTTREAEGFSGMTYSETFYKPMVEIVDYLHANNFDVYIVTACEREVSRALVEDRLNIPLNHVVGSDLGMAATRQGDTPANEYTLAQDEELALSGEVLSDCGKTNKVVYIQREIGKRPVLAFGNSSGDFAMLNYAQSNDEYAGMGVLIVADDTEREYGNSEKAADMNKEVAAQGWTGVSMRDDWATIYGPDVLKTELPGEQALPLAA